MASTLGMGGRRTDFLALAVLWNDVGTLGVPHRILSLADAYVAMISPRPYRGPLPGEDARAIIEAGAGTQWDPFRVEVFLELVRHQDQDAAAAS